MTTEAFDRIASLFPGRWDRHYSATKLRTDPLYQAVAAELSGSSLPLLDLGCGLGLLAFYLRENGHRCDVTGLDYDSRKIIGASHASTRSGFTGLAFREHDARTGLPDHEGNVTILDILQFFEPAAQATVVTEAARRVAPGGKLVIRSGLRDTSWRFKVTVAGDWIAKATFWMRAAPSHYPTAEDFRRLLGPFGAVDIRPLWGGTPFNNHLIVLTREGPSAGPSPEAR